MSSRERNDSVCRVHIYTELYHELISVSYIYDGIAL